MTVMTTMITMAERDRALGGRGRVPAEEQIGVAGADVRERADGEIPVMQTAQPPIQPIHGPKGSGDPGEGGASSPDRRGSCRRTRPRSRTSARTRRGSTAGRLPPAITTTMPMIGGEQVGRSRRGQADHQRVDESDRVLLEAGLLRFVQAGGAVGVGSDTWRGSLAAARSASIRTWVGPQGSGPLTAAHHQSDPLVGGADLGGGEATGCARARGWRRAGEAWLRSVLAGIGAAAWDLREAEHFVGTSAGSIVSAVLGRRRRSETHAARAVAGAWEEAVGAQESPRRARQALTGRLAGAVAGSPRSRLPSRRWFLGQAAPGAPPWSASSAALPRREIPGLQEELDRLASASTGGCAWRRGARRPAAQVVFGAPGALRPRSRGCGAGLLRRPLGVAPRDHRGPSVRGQRCVERRHPALRAAAWRVVLCLNPTATPRLARRPPGRGRARLAARLLRRRRSSCADAVPRYASWPPTRARWRRSGRRCSARAGVRGRGGGLHPGPELARRLGPRWFPPARA